MWNFYSASVITDMCHEINVFTEYLNIQYQYFKKITGYADKTIKIKKKIDTFSILNLILIGMLNIFLVKFKKQVDNVRALDIVLCEFIMVLSTQRNEIFV